mgnify:CR=1 FL=1
MITNEIIIALIGVLSTVIGTWTSWFLARKKYNVEVDSSLIENMQRSLDFYMRLSDDNKDRLEEALIRNERLEEEVQRLKEQVNDLIFQYQKSLRRQLKAKDEEISRIKHNKKN